MLWSGTTLLWSNLEHSQASTVRYRLYIRCCKLGTLCYHTPMLQSTPECSVPYPKFADDCCWWAMNTFFFVSGLITISTRLRHEVLCSCCSQSPIPTCRAHPWPVMHCVCFCYDFVILSSYGLLFISTQLCMLPPSLFFVIAHSAIHAFLISWLVVYVIHSTYLFTCTCILADSSTYISIDTCISVDS